MRLKKNGLISSLFLVCTALGTQVALAAESPEQGEATQQWLELQKSGTQAASEARPLSGDVAKRNYERYLNSFEHEIPAEFQQGGEGR